MLCFRKKTDALGPNAFENLLALDETAIGTLRQSNPTLEAMFGPTGMLSALGDPEAMASYPEEVQRGLKLMVSLLANPDSYYAGCPVRVEGRTIGTCCAIFVDRPDDLSDIERRVQMEHALEVGELLSSLGALDGIGGSPNA